MIRLNAIHAGLKRCMLKQNDNAWLASRVCEHLSGNFSSCMHAEKPAKGNDSSAKNICEYVIRRMTQLQSPIIPREKRELSIGGLVKGSRVFHTPTLRKQSAHFSIASSSSSSSSSSSTSSPDGLRRSFRESRVVGFPMEVIYAVVADVQHYHKFVPWCVKSRVLARTGTNQS